MYIGDIYLPILSNIDKKSVSKITKEIAGINAKEPRTVSIRRNLQPITLEGYLYNDGEKDDEQYAEDVEALQYRSAGYCYTQYADLDGFIEIENADAPQTSEELGVRNYSIEGKYLPATKYERVVEVETEMRENEFNIEFPPHVALPIGATNVRVKTSQDSVKLSAPAFMAGDIPIYRPFPAFYPDDVTHSTGDTPKYDTTAYKMSYNLLDAKDESISYTFVSGVDVPLGSYRVVLRMKEDTTIASDAHIVVLSGDNVVVDSLHTLVGDNVWNIVKSASFNITQRGITYTIMVSKAEADVANLAVNYGFLLPEKRARVAFDVAAEYDVGECKVFDTITTDSEESTWIQVFNPEHDFAGDIVVQNSMFRWVIKQTAWKDATKVYNISGSAPVEIGELYNKAFGDDSVAIKFKEIKPNYLKFTFELDTGNVTSESTSAKEIDTVEITPFNVVIDKDVIGAYKDHYTFESTPDVMVEYENGVIAGIDDNSVYGLIKSVDVTSSIDGDIIETTGSKSSDSYVVPFVIPCEITSYLYKQAADLVISKDNGDIERKFWKDDFSVDSSSQYTGDVASFTWDTVNAEITSTDGVSYKRIKYIEPISDSALGAKISFSLKCSEVSGYRGGVLLGYIGSTPYTLNIVTDATRVSMFMRIGSSPLEYVSRLSSTATFDTNYHNYVLIINPDGTFEGWFDGVKGNPTSFVLPTGMNLTPGIVTDAADGKTICWKDVTYTPSISYADGFTSDTTERYQAVEGTVAYDDINKRMNVTTATGVNGKASGRLKSYKFCEGSQIYDVLLPTGADGDFICLATHSANGLMTDGIGVGLQSDGAGNWNLATLSGTTVTEGADSGLDDADVARIEIEKDITGAYWYYIYDAAGTKPTTATGKLYTTLTEGYTGWYANGNSKTYAIVNISIRAESIVGRTNVEVTEDVFNSVTGEIESRTYFKPIHRGAMLETYHDGTQEVIGTVFVDDCNWDRSAEYIQANPTSFTFDTVNGVIVETETGVQRSDQLKIKTRFGSAHYHYKFTKIVDARYMGVFIFCDQMETSHTCPIDNATTCPNAELYFVCVEFTSPNTYLRAYRRTVGDKAMIGSTEISTISDGETHTIDILHNAGTGNIRVFYDGIQKINITDTTYTSGYCGPTRIYSDSTRTKFSEIQIIAASSDATNGIAACIPPIGGGARYGVEESVYNTFTTENVNKGVYLTTAKVKTTNPNADEASLEFINETDSDTLSLERTETEKSLTVTADYTVLTESLYINDDKTDTLTVGVKNSTTCDQSANYVESLSLIPVSGDDVLYPQDLAFISGVKPSQKRKVEVK